MRASLRYSTARLLIFVICLGLAWLVGPRDEPVLLVIIAAVVSMVISIFALRGMRRQFATDIADRVESRSQRRRAKTAQRRRDGIDDESAEDSEISLGEATGTDSSTGRVRPVQDSQVETDRQ